MSYLYINKNEIKKMKTTLNNLMAAVIVTGIIVFATLAVIHIVHLTQAGLINWNN